METHHSTKPYCTITKYAKQNAHKPNRILPTFIHTFSTHNQPHLPQTHPAHHTAPKPQHLLTVSLLACQFRTIAEILLDEFTADHAQERGRRLAGHSLSKQGLASACNAIENERPRTTKPCPTPHPNYGRPANKMTKIGNFASICLNG